MDIAHSLGHHILIGITSPHFLEHVAKKEFIEKIQSYEIRQKAIEDYLLKKSKSDWTIISIDDKWGGATEHEADAMIVSEESFQEGVRINQVRKKNNIRPLTLVVIPRILDDDGFLITSTSIRNIEHENNIN